MTNFNESKLSKILARAIVAPEDRAPFTALATPVYCPDNKGVRANKLFIVNPSPITTFLQTQTITDSVAGDVETSTTETVVGGTKKVITNITNINYTSSTINYLDEFFEADEKIDFTKDFDITFTYLYPQNQTAGDLFTVFNIAADDDKMYANSIVLRVNATVTEGVISDVELAVGSTKENATVNLYAQIADPPLVVGSGYDFKFHWNAELQRFIMTIVEHTTKRLLYGPVDRPGASPDGVKSNSESQDGADYTLANTTEFSVSSPLLTRQVVTTDVEFTPQENVVEIELSNSLRRSYNIPYDVELKSEFDITDLVKSDMIIQFKKAVSDAIIAYVKANSSSFTTIDGTSMNNIIGSVIAENVINGTGCKFSVYGYDNGAPVEYTQGADQLKFPGLFDDSNPEDNISIGMFKNIFSSKDVVNVPAMFYIEKPSVVFDEEHFVTLQQQLVSGGVRSYAREKVNFDVTSQDISTLGIGVFGTNDSFAVGFTEPRISIQRNQEDFSYTMAVEIYYGVKPIHPENVNIITETGS